jgi:lipoteichoic acid synthase
VTRAVERRRRRRRRRSRAGIFLIFFLGSLGLFLWAVDFGSLSLRADPGSTEADAPPVSDGNAGITPAEGVREVNTEEDGPDAGAGAEHPAAHAGLTQTPQTQKRNIVLIHLESTRARSVTPYNEDLNTTPFLNELAKSSLLVERAYVGSIPRSFMSNIAVNCGIQPPAQTDADDPGGMPVPCLAGLLGDQGYSSALFSSNADKYGDSATIDWGYEKAFAPPESGVPPQHWSMAMDTERFAHTSFYGYEEDIMLQPSQDWLEEHKDEPFVVEYLTSTGHDEYNCLGTRYGSEDFSEDDLLNHYLNCLRLQDIFLRNLFQQYQELGLYNDTIFVLFGDHGEGFGEHGRFLHGDTIWEEGLKVPLIIHAPGWFEGGERVEGLSNYTDVLPTVMEMLGYEVKDGEYPGYSLLHEPPEDRTLMFSCISIRECMASIKGNEKYIYHYGNQPEEVYDLSNDPLEENNLADEYSKEELDKRREELFAWLSRIEAQYYGHGPVSGNGQPEENTRQRAKRSEGQPTGSTVAVGQPLTVGDVEWTVTSAYPADRLTSYVDGRTKRGNFVVVDFLFKNNSDEDLTLSSDSPVLFDGSGRRFEFDTDTYLYIDWAKNIFRRSVVPGDSPEGRVIFKVPPDASQFQLQLGEENPFSNKSGYVNLGF